MVFINILFNDASLELSLCMYKVVVSDSDVRLLTSFMITYVI